MIITLFITGNPNTCYYQFIIYNPHHHLVVVFHLFIVDKLGLFFNLKSHKAHMFYDSDFSHCTLVTIMLVKDK